MFRLFEMFALKKKFKTKRIIDQTKVAQNDNLITENKKNKNGHKRVKVSG